MAEEKHRISSGRKTILIGLAIAGLIGLGVLVTLAPRLQNSCEGILEQTAPRLKVHLEVIKSNGAAEIGQEKIQELSESAQKVGLHLKTCCKVLEHGKLGPRQFQRCIDTASAYERQIAFVAKELAEVAVAKEPAELAEPNKRIGKDVLQQKVASINDAIQAATSHVKNLSRQVAQIKPPPVLQSRLQRRLRFEFRPKCRASTPNSSNSPDSASCGADFDTRSDATGRTGSSRPSWRST